MGIYEISCTKCNMPCVWFSGNNSQLCEACEKAQTLIKEKTWKEIEKEVLDFCAEEGIN